MRFSAFYIDINNDGEEGFVSLFIKWGAFGQYIDISREIDDANVYCEFLDQSNGSLFRTLTFKYSNKTLSLSAIYPETFIVEQRVNNINIDLSRLTFNERDLLINLNNLFVSTQDNALIKKGSADPFC